MISVRRMDLRITPVSLREARMVLSISLKAIPAIAASRGIALLDTMRFLDMTSPRIRIRLLYRI